ncbi:uncharacterized protein LOC103885667 isoform X5 [Papio anubis]|uniref:uncharacterized protein LOC103885667 isoform X5 n=1 Tax=Papio anubis TaxID=9555 RepID=UPI0012AE33E0|nr:uncharacterized protein LOC103885667 isoform X5 [Papio anubis]
MVSLEEDLYWPTGPTPVSARSSSPGVLKLWPFVAPWSPALSCVSSSTQEGPLALTGIDGETGGRLALDLLFLGQWPLARCPVPDALKLRSFMVHWSPALSCGEHIRVPMESCVSELFCPGGAMALSGIGFGGQEGQRCPVSMMDQCSAWIPSHGHPLPTFPTLIREALVGHMSFCCHPRW